MLKSIFNRIIYLGGTLNFELVRKNDTCRSFSTKTLLPLAVLRYTGEDCLNIEKTPSLSSTQI